MGRYILIKKIKEKDGIGYYSVCADSNDKIAFYMGIDKNKNELIIYSSPDFKTCLKTITAEMLSGNNPIVIPDLKDQSSLMHALYKGYLVLKGNLVSKQGGFPDSLSHFA